jgi:hypothetical protein
LQVQVLPASPARYRLELQDQPQSNRRIIDASNKVAAQAIRGKASWGGPMARNLREVIAALPAERHAKIAAAHSQNLIAEEQRLIAEKKKRQLEEAKRVMELDHNLIVIVVLIIALPIIAALAVILTALAVGHQ